MTDERKCTGPYRAKHLLYLLAYHIRGSGSLELQASVLDVKEFDNVENIFPIVGQYTQLIYAVDKLRDPVNHEGRLQISCLDAF